MMETKRGGKRTTSKQLDRVAVTHSFRDRRVSGRKNLRARTRVTRSTSSGVGHPNITLTS